MRRSSAAKFTPWPSTSLFSGRFCAHTLSVLPLAMFWVAALVSLASVSFTRCEIASPALVSRSILPRIRRHIDLVRRPRLIQQLLKLSQRLSTNRPALAPYYHESHWPVEYGKLLLNQIPSQLLGQSQAYNASELSVDFLDIILDVDFAIANHRGLGKIRVPLARF